MIDAGLALLNAHGAAHMAMMLPVLEGFLAKPSTDEETDMVPNRTQTPHLGRRLKSGGNRIGGYGRRFEGAGLGGPASFSWEAVYPAP